MDRNQRHTIGVIATIAVAILAIIGLATLGFRALSVKYCRPVVPEMAITFPGETLTVLDGEVLLVYYEHAPKPFSEDERPESPRFGGCNFLGTSCLGDRARYEVRTEAPRYQGLEIRGMGGFGEQGRDGPGNPRIGTLRWTGPSYPHRIEAECDLDNLDPETACKITRRITDYADYAREFGASTSYASTHDQCTPTTF